MNYIYDITLNFNDEFYDFYEWNSKDKIEFILKIPIFKVQEDEINDITKNEIKLSKEFLKKILNETEVYCTNVIKILRYACIFVSEEISLAVMFDEKGKIIKKSSISPDEEDDILEVSKSLKYTLLDYKIISKNKVIKSFYTRKEIDISNFLENELNYIYKEKEDEKLKYIYYEIFNKKNNDINNIYFDLLDIIRKKEILMYKIKNIVDITKKEKIMNEKS